jgi:RimJ/RimL family protein N-acetyltransferase
MDPAMRLPHTLSTPRLLLRIPRVADADAAFAAWTSDPLVTRYLRWRPHGTTEQTRQFLAEQEAAWAAGVGHRAWVIERDGAVVGMIGVSPHGHAAEVGYVLGRAWWGQGLMSEAARAVVDATLALPGMFRLYATCHVDNLASARVLEKAGMRFEGILRRLEMLPNAGPEPADARMYARVHGDP